MKIGVYAICKNEEKNVNGWFESCKDADVIALTDTGSTDTTLIQVDDLLTRYTHLDLHHGYVVPWRFDDAFNMALSHLPPDVDVAIRLDLDERLQPGWRAALEDAWTPGTNMLRYPYVWDWNERGEPNFFFNGDRIHSRANWRWSGVTHEGLQCRTQRGEAYTTALKIYQFPDRAKPRPNDLPMLEEAVRETPHDARLWAYLGREYLWRGMREKCVETYTHFLQLPNGDRAERMMAFCHIAKCDPEFAPIRLQWAIKEAPEYREPWIELMTYHYTRQQWQDCYAAAQGALKILMRPATYLSLPQSWSDYPHDICAIAAYKLGLMDVAEEQAKLALAKNPQDERLKINLERITTARAA